MTIDVSGEALKLLDDFVHYASTYPKQVASALWWCEESFVFVAGLLKEAYDKAVAANEGKL